MTPEDANKEQKQAKDPLLVKQYSDAYYKKHKEEILKRNALWIKNNKEKVKQYELAYKISGKRAITTKKYSEFTQEQKDRKNQATRKYRAKNKEKDREKIKEQKRLSYQRNKEKCKDKHRKYYLKNKETIKLRIKEWQKNNKELAKKTHLASVKRYQLKNRDKLRLKAKQRRQLKKLQIREANRRYRENNREKIRLWGQKWRIKNRERLLFLKRRNHHEKIQERIQEEIASLKNDNWFMEAHNKRVGTKQEENQL